MATTIREVIDALEAAFKPSLQESYDNTGIQLGKTDRGCSGVMLCVDVTPAIVEEAKALGCNLIVSHHPLIFRAKKNIAGEDRVDQSIYAAIRNDVSVYSCHTSVDNTPQEGVSWEMAKQLGLKDVETLAPINPSGEGSGAVGNLSEETEVSALIERVKRTFGSPVARCSRVKDPEAKVKRVALCGGAGNSLIGETIASGADAYITSDCKHNDFIDNADRILLIDIGHYESERCTVGIFGRTLRNSFPELKIYESKTETNPINYI